MWCLSCFKPSTSEDPFEAETDIAKEVSRLEAETQEDEQLVLAMQESARIHQRKEEEEKRRKQQLEEDAQIATGFLYEDRERQNFSDSSLEDEDDQLASAIQESARLHQREEEEEKRRKQELEEDAQIATGFLYEDRERLNYYNSALEDEDEELAKTVEESLKEKEKRQHEEQMKKDEELALIVQESLNMVESPPRVEEHKSMSHNSSLDADEQLSKAVEESLKEKEKRKQHEEQVKKDEQLALIVQKSLNMVESPPHVEERKSMSHNSSLDADEQLAIAVEESLKEKGKRKQFQYEQAKKDRDLAATLQESLNMVDSPSRLEENKAPLDEDEQRVIWESLKGKGQIKESKNEVEEDEKLIEVNPPRSMCRYCNSEIEDRRSLNVSGVLWHPECFCCDACHNPIAIHDVENHVSNSRGKFHKSCDHRYCYVCNEKVKIRSFNYHHFWKERYCPAHESDRTPECFSCERLEPRGTNYVLLDDGRWLCLECMESAVMDTYEAQPLHFEIREFFEGLHMKIPKEFPFLLVEKQALNKAKEEEKINNQPGVVTRGICLSEEQIVTSVSKGPKLGPNKQLIGMARESRRVVSECEVTAILILYGLPRLLTGYILAHEMMHAYLRLNQHRNLNKVLEEGLCQVLGHMWLESQTYSSNDAEASSSASTSPIPNVSKKGKLTRWLQIPTFRIHLKRFFVGAEEDMNQPFETHTIYKYTAINTHARLLSVFSLVQLLKFIVLLGLMNV